ncbi:hypothetical protein BCF11_4593 [Collimonas sp. PA-H2]|uniref:hypothetical protein n=1 Tax=Collimonas sp. PA-H2 TaxID=1881062 RepID=UPI000BF749DC|nr:hypothetical protein [Collimonas sp. PA-H2]PFH12118.1 hypothetical protein BCF11_4593 [Collimonas sp. PA-H2]
MFDFIRNALLPAKRSQVVAEMPIFADVETLPAEVVVDENISFQLASQIAYHEKFPILDWDAVRAWVSETVPPDLQAKAWLASERAWLLHFRAALGTGFAIRESENAILLSSLENNVARATLGYMELTLKRVIKTLDGIAQVVPLGKDILIIFDDGDSYYNYVSCCYPDAGEFAFSGGMYINGGCGHYVTVKEDLRQIEPVITHEMTHGCVSHLPLPAWLNEGLAVNTEQRFAPRADRRRTPQELHRKHLAFWREDTLQEFWSGQSFLRTDDGNLLSYDLARILVAHMAKDWNAFREFALAADLADGGAAAARDHLGVELGELVCTLFAWQPEAAFGPDPRAWASDPERGAFDSAHQLQAQAALILLSGPLD